MKKYEILETMAIQYCQPHRYYHNMNHIARMFSFAKEYKLQLDAQQTMAIWFHDIIYNVRKEDNIDAGGKYHSNESLSAHMAVDYMCGNGIIFSTDEINMVSRIILDTEEETPTIPQSKLVIDLDLIDLAFEERYNTNGLLLRKEYEHLTHEQWQDGRRAWLKKFIARPTIFVSDEIIERYPTFEYQARLNLERDLEILL